MTIADFEEGLREALDLVGTHTLDDVVRLIEAGDAAAFWNDGACLVVQVNQYPRCRALDYWLAAGELGSVVELLPEIEEWGQAKGCTVAHMGGRKGWSRVLHGLGWDTGYVAMRKEL